MPTPVLPWLCSLSFSDSFPIEPQLVECCYNPFHEFCFVSFSFLTMLLSFLPNMCCLQTTHSDYYFDLLNPQLPVNHERLHLYLFDVTCLVCFPIHLVFHPV